MHKPIVEVKNFSGPLDLLIHLIEINKLDIYDIPIVDITEQYISYLDSMKEPDLDLASEFLVMAAMLLQIKSRTLLPKLPGVVDEEADPREMLVQMLLEYRRFRQLAGEMEKMLESAGKYHTRKPLYAGRQRNIMCTYPVSRLAEALAGIMAPEKESIAYVARERREYDVGLKMKEMLRRLALKPEGLEFKTAFVRSGSDMERIAGFLAVLELLRLKQIKVSQSSLFGPIYMFLEKGGAEHV